MTLLIRMGVNEEVFAWTVAASPLDVNAFRVRQFNSIVLPLGLLASSLLGHNGVPEFVSEGGLGFILGHEIMHSLDHSGRGFDLQGKLALVWDQSSLVRLVLCSLSTLISSLIKSFIEDTKESPNVSRNPTPVITSDKFCTEASR